MSDPVRTCIGCRRRAAVADLVRTVAVSTPDGAAVLVDPRGRLPGRGAWLHPDPECLAAARRRNAFRRALRVPSALSDAGLRLPAESAN